MAHAWEEQMSATEQRDEVDGLALKSMSKALAMGRQISDP
jgi:hypothetical protein